MEIEFDPAKDLTNRTKHGVSLARAPELDVSVVVPDERRDYGEVRLRAFGRLDGVAYCLTYTMRGWRLRAISLRRASPREYHRYGL